jgi:hypothetical protein
MAALDGLTIAGSKTRREPTTRPPSSSRGAMDWDDVRVFLAVAREGSMRAAGRALGLRRECRRGHPVSPLTAGTRLAGGGNRIRTPGPSRCPPASFSHQCWTYDGIRSGEIRLMDCSLAGGETSRRPPACNTWQAARDRTRRRRKR